MERQRNPIPEVDRNFSRARVFVQYVAAVVAVEQDTQLMLRVRQGDEASFALLLDRYRTPLVTFLYRMVRNQAVAEELAQETFLRVYRSRERYEPSAKFTTWLYRIATNLALNVLQSGDSRCSSLDGDNQTAPKHWVADAKPLAEQNLLRRSMLNEVRTAIGELPEKQRAAVLMHKYEGMDYERISEILGLSESAVKSLLFRAYEKLRGRLGHLAGRSGQ